MGMHGMKATAGRVGKWALVAVAITALGACAPRYRTHGYMPPEEEVQQIVPGIDTRASVEDVIGVPNAAGVLNASGYYYIESEVRHFGWQRPKVIDREVLAVTFDEAGVVDGITSYGLEDGNVVPLTRRVTRSGDGDLNFIRKLFGNLGGINVADVFGG